MSVFPNSLQSSRQKWISWEYRYLNLKVCLYGNGSDPNLIPSSLSHHLYVRLFPIQSIFLDQTPFLIVIVKISAILSPPNVGKLPIKPFPLCDKMGSPNKFRQSQINQPKQQEIKIINHTRDTDFLRGKPFNVKGKTTGP